MSVGRDRRRRRRRRRRNLWVPLLVLLAFGIGVALGQALHDNPRPGGTQTIIRTSTP